MSLPEKAVYGRPVECHSCGYVMDAATELGELGVERTLPHGPEVPPGSILLCIACGALGQVAHDGTMVAMPRGFIESVLVEHPELVQAIMARTIVVSKTGSQPTAHPFKRAYPAGWKASDDG